MKASDADLCGYCGHRRDWHEIKFNKSISGLLCQCIGTRPDQNRNWCNCAGFQEQKEVKHAIPE